MMASILSLLDTAGSALSKGEDAQQHIEAVSRCVEECRAAGNPAAAEQLLRDLHDTLLPRGGRENAAQHAADDDAVLGSVMTECLEAIAGLADLSANCRRLSEALIVRFACCAPREAGIVLPACLGRQVG